MAAPPFAMPMAVPGTITTMTPVTQLGSSTPMQLMTIMTPMLPVPASTIPVACGHAVAPMPITTTVAAVPAQAHPEEAHPSIPERPASVHGPPMESLRPAPASQTTSAPKASTHQKNVQHNMAERRRVRKLTRAYFNLHGLLQKRPELVVDARADAPPSLRHSGPGGPVIIEDDGGSATASSTGTGDYTVIDPSSMPPYHQILYRSTATIDSLFSIVDLLSGEIDRITQVPRAGAHLVDQALGRAPGEQPFIWHHTSMPASDAYAAGAIGGRRMV